MTQIRFDPTFKQLVEPYPLQWVDYLAERFQLPRSRQVEVIDADVSTVSAAVDKVIRVGGRRPWLLHLEAQASHNARLARNLLLWNVLLNDRHDLPVCTVVLLLRPEADRASITGEMELLGPDEHSYLTFRYLPLRLWQLPAEELLSGGPALLPLAPVAQLPQSRLPGVLQQVHDRLQRELPPTEASKLWGATGILMGLQYSLEFTEQLMKEVQTMEESAVYRGLIERGRPQEAREILFGLAGKNLGEPDDATRQSIESLADLNRLRDLIDRAGQFTTWEELLAASSRTRTQKRRRRT